MLRQGSNWWCGRSPPQSRKRSWRMWRRRIGRRIIVRQRSVILFCLVVSMTSGVVTKSSSTSQSHDSTLQLQLIWFPKAGNPQGSQHCGQHPAPLLPAVWQVPTESCSNLDTFQFAHRIANVNWIFHEFASLVASNLRNKLVSADVIKTMKAKNGWCSPPLVDCLHEVQLPLSLSLMSTHWHCLFVSVCDCLAWCHSSITKVRMCRCWMPGPRRIRQRGRAKWKTAWSCEIHGCCQVASLSLAFLSLSFLPSTTTQAWPDWTLGTVTQIVLKL